MFNYIFRAVWEVRTLDVDVLLLTVFVGFGPGGHYRPLHSAPRSTDDMEGKPAGFLLSATQDILLLPTI